MDSSLTSSAKDEPSDTSPSAGGETTNSCENGGGATDVGVEVGPPSAKRAKIENGATDTVGVGSSGDSSSPREHGTSISEDVSRNDNEQNESEDSNDQQQDASQHHLDSEEINFDEEEATSDDEELFQQILALARSGRIPLEYLAARGIHIELDDDEPVEYPFDNPPSSIADVADFIQSDKCQRIMVLAG
jgi:hypothetical protein